ncbi:MAG: MbnP family protein [Chitinophagales bacterium]
MKNYLLIFLALGLFSISSFAQNSIQLQINHKLGDEAFVMQTEATNNIGNKFNTTRLEYYISEITILHNGTIETKIDDLWVLANAGDETTLVDLGMHNIDAIEGISFHIGVDKEHNHADPASYGNGHPLAPKFPSMHWGWAAGYRFIAYEGKGGNSLNQDCQLHGLGDDNYFQTSVDVVATAVNNEIIIDLNADYTRVLEDINVNSGVIVHGDNGAAKKALENFRDYVFSVASDATSIVDFSEINSVNLYPNPANVGRAFIAIDATQNLQYQIKVYDVLGREIQSLDNVQSNVPTALNLEVAGLYIVSLVKEGQSVITKKLQVN